MAGRFCLLPNTPFILSTSTAHRRSGPHHALMFPSRPLVPCSCSLLSAGCFPGILLAFPRVSEHSATPVTCTNTTSSCHPTAHLKESLSMGDCRQCPPRFHCLCKSLRGPGGWDLSAGKSCNGDLLLSAHVPRFVCSQATPFPEWTCQGTRGVVSPLLRRAPCVLAQHPWAPEQHTRRGVSPTTSCARLRWSHRSGVQMTSLALARVISSWSGRA